MEFFILLVLSIGFCQASSLQREADHDDPEVVDAVAKAIKVLNEDPRYRTKFALHAILHAYRIAGSGKKFHIFYQVREATCHTAMDEPLQSCDPLGSSKGPSGNCTADIDIHELEKLASISQKCKLNPGQETLLSNDTECLGCWHPIHPKSLEVLPIVRYTIRQFNNHSKHPALFHLERVIKIDRQVVAGWNYRFEYLIKETNCSKNDFPDLSPACRPLLGGQQGSCTVHANVNSADSLEYAEQTCRLPAEKKERPPDMCVGCPNPLPLDSPELKELLEAALESYNAKSNRDFYFKVVAVLKATSQVVNGVIYKFDFKIQQTTCSKAVVENPNENCTAVEDGELLYCSGSEFQPLPRDLQSIINPLVKCSEQPPLQHSRSYIQVLGELSSISQEGRINAGQEKLLSMDTECMGCWHPIHPKSLELLPIVRYTIRQFNNRSKHPALFEVGKITEAYVQVVAGLNYHFEYLIKETNCSKNEFPDLSPACRPLLGGQHGSCIVYAYVDLTNSLEYAEQACTLPAEKKERPPDMCVGCPNPLPLDSPELKELLEAALESYNAKSNRDFYFKVVAVLKATSQVVNGVIYEFDFRIQQTTCSKAVFEKPNENCTAVEDGELLYCSGSEFQPLPRDLQSIINPLVKCSEQPPLQQQGSCIADIYISGNSLVTTQEECKVQVEEKAKSPAYKCTACLMPIPPDSPELKEPLEAIMKYLNCSKGVEVTKATKQVLSGIIYRTDFIMQKTYCFKPEFQRPNEDSIAVEDVGQLRYRSRSLQISTRVSSDFALSRHSSYLLEDVEDKAEFYNLFFCHTLADVKPGKSVVIRLITCTDQPPFQLASRPPGFTPFTRK